MTRWIDQKPDQAIIDALDHAREKPEEGNQHQKRHWSESFANGCAIAIAKEVKAHPTLQSKRINPESLEGGTEPLTPLGAGTQKRIDVTVVDPVLGLEIGFSLKGFNFKDAKSGSYDKNLTGRLYELADEVRLVHEHLPHAFMVAVFFLPLEGSSDKTEKAQSSFAHAVMKLRERTGRLDPALQSHAARADASYVGLYTAVDDPRGFQRGLVRFFNTKSPPPRRGRPKISDTLALSEMVDEVVKEATFAAETEWGDPEVD